MPPPRLAHLRRLLLPLRSAPAPHPLSPNPSRPLPLLRPPLSPSLLLLPRAMAGAAHAGVASGSAEYEEVLGCLASLITQKVRADTGWSSWPNTGAGAVDRAVEGGARRGDQREGFNMHICRVNPSIMWLDISEEKFIRYFWWCWNRLKDRTGDDVPMPAYFRFLALLAFKIFSDEQVDVAVLEVGLGGKYDAKNVVRTPVVCGISSLGYDHMEILGNTLGEIAGEKAGILKKGVPAYTVPQPEEAMAVLMQRASELGVCLRVVQPLDPQKLEGQPLGLDGEHQYMNAGLAVSLANTWLERQGYLGRIHAKHSGTLPDQFIEGLSNACLQGRAQIVPDPQVNSEYDKHRNSSLVFYLDGAHSQKAWKCVQGGLPVLRISMECNQILLFNCMAVRDPQRLLPRLLDTCAENGLHFEQALFVPNQSQYNKLGSLTSPPSEREQINLSWQLSLQRVWESLPRSNKGLMVQTPVGQAQFLNLFHWRLSG